LGRLDLLRQLFGNVIVPEAVTAEIAAGRAQGVDLPDLTALPWVRVQSAPLSAVAPGDLGAGELSVLSLAAARPGAVVVLDDGLARRYARRAHIRFTGACGILLRGKERGLVPAIKPLLDQLVRLGFHPDAGTRANVLKLAGRAE
jgi:hypothetical protein